MKAFQFVVRIACGLIALIAMGYFIATEDPAWLAAGGAWGAFTFMKDAWSSDS